MKPPWLLLGVGLALVTVLVAGFFVVAYIVSQAN